MYSLAKVKADTGKYLANDNDQRSETSKAGPKVGLL